MCSSKTKEELNLLKYRKDIKIYLVMEECNKCVGMDSDSNYFEAHFNEDGSLYDKKIISKKVVDRYIKKLIVKFGN